MTMPQPRLSPSLTLLVALTGGAGCGSSKPAPTVDTSVSPPPDDGGTPGDDAPAAVDGTPGLSRAAVLGALGTCAWSTAREAATAAAELESAVKTLETQPDTR